MYRSSVSVIVVLVSVKLANAKIVLVQIVVLKQNELIEAKKAVIQRLNGCLCLF